MIITKGDNVHFINSPAKTPLLFTQQAADSSTNPNAATQDGTTGNVLQIQGIASRVRLNGLAPKSEIRVIRPQPSRVTIITIDPADATQFKLVDNFTVGQVLYFFVATDLVYSSKVEFYRASPGERSAFGKDNFFQVRLRQGDTETKVLTRLADAINDLFVTALGKYPFKADFGVTNAGKFTIQGRGADAVIKLFAYDTGGIDTPATQLAAFAPYPAQLANEGQGNWDTLQATYRLQTDATNEPYSLQQFDRVLEGAHYTCLSFVTVTERLDLVSNELSDSPVTGSRNQFTLYVRDGAEGEAYLTKLLNFLKRTTDASITQVYVLADGTSQATPGAAGTPNTFLANTGA